ncbi:ABC-type uncharacterized transport system, auxiliary component [Jannaschia seosinensis]|uniref:ABC-type uncharacterized transport system, auxiliary component n=1 Tax=Jannaschia seosinensis TaxID=313367 RepID=A0A0M7B833_9RHOB|nr:ABC-type transport auxiliary lipoprotein family protein [Jannaschia seosinensis]CUH34947.1 ABC-type uncharacterized transport system, auxiliary component [Jannaschia seosinensis]
MTPLPRRALLLGLIATTSGCATLSALDDAARVLPTFELAPPAGRTGARQAVALVVPPPAAPASVSTDRILVKPDPLSVTYLPEARWSQEAPLLLQSLVVRSIAGTDRIAHVGTPESGPVPDYALLVRIDAFQAEPVPDRPNIPVRVALGATLVRDSDQRIVATEGFARTALAASDRPAAIVAAFQEAVASLLPALADWAADRV